VRRLWILSGVLVLSSAVAVTGYYFSSYEEQTVGYKSEYCVVTVFDDLDDLERQRYNQSNVSISGVKEVGDTDYCSLSQRSKVGKLTGKLSLNLNYTRTLAKRYYRNEADEIIEVDVKIAT
jgi:hypothetical protein